MTSLQEVLIDVNNEPEQKISKPANQKERAKWNSQTEFILAIAGYAIGLGNVWRFPYMLYEFGGGAFLIPYWFGILTFGAPLFYAEVSVAQFASRGPIRLYGYMMPIFQGIGWAMILPCMYVAIYYNTIIAWVLYYLWTAISVDPLPWTTCLGEHNTKYCVSSFDVAQLCLNRGNLSDFFVFEKKCWSIAEADNVSIIDMPREEHVNDTLWKDITKSDRFKALNYGDDEEAIARQRERLVSLSSGTVFKEYDYYRKKGILSSSSTEFFYFSMYDFNSKGDFDITKGEEGEVQTGLLAVLIVSWVVCYLCVMYGIKSIGKVVWVTATAPFIILAILLLRGVTLDNASEGIKYYISIDFSKLANSATWKGAFGQIFFTLSVCAGGLGTMASFNTFHNNTFRDTLIVIVLDSLCAFIAGFTVFSTLGFLKKQLNKKSIKDVVASGPMLAFVVYPEAIAHFPFSQRFFQILFFLMLLMLGLDSQFALAEVVTNAIMEQFVILQNSWWSKQLTILTVIVMLMISALSTITQCGMISFNIFDTYAFTWGMFFLAAIVLICSTWFYGASRFYGDMRMMFGGTKHAKSWRTNRFLRTIGPIFGPLGWYWRICQQFVGPMLLLGMCMWIISDIEPSTITIPNMRIIDLDVSIMVLGEPRNLHLVQNEQKIVFTRANTGVFAWAMSLTPLVVLFTGAVIQSIRCRINQQAFSTLFQPTEKYGPEIKEYNDECVRRWNSENSGSWWKNALLKHKTTLTDEPEN